MYIKNKLKALFAVLIVLLSCSVFSNSAFAQTAEQGTLLLNPDSDCVIVFDGESLGTITANNVKKIKADFGDHILNATFAGNKTLKKIVTVNSTKQVIITISLTTDDEEMPKKLSKEKATELYKAELLKPSPVDLKKLKYYLTKGVDVHTTDIHGWSLLHEAAFQGDTELIKFCLERGLPIDAKSTTIFDFSTPLSCANDQNHPDAAKLLLSHNATYGIADGYAEMEYDSSNKYKGDFKNGKRNGHGIFYYANGNVYDGEWTKDKQNGKGALTFLNAGKYEGDFIDGAMSGQGEFAVDSNSKFNGKKYIGHFEKNIFSGQGTYYWKNGSKYEGNWSNGKKNGQGKMFYADGGKYEGNWANDMKNGQGIQYYPSGNIYNGNWEGDKASGQGSWTWSNGDRYEGNWSNGSRNGEGTLYMNSGAKYTGNWMNNKKNGQGAYYSAGGDHYEGNFSNDQKNGKGTYYFQNGDVYTGEWLNDKKSGYGIMTLGKENPGGINNCAKCKIYKGYWLNDIKNGDGGCYDEKGNLIFEGRFVNDYPIGTYPNR